MPWRWHSRNWGPSRRAPGSWAGARGSGFSMSSPTPRWGSARWSSRTACSLLLDQRLLDPALRVGALHLEVAFLVLAEVDDLVGALERGEHLRPILGLGEQLDVVDLGAQDVAVREDRAGLDQVAVESGALEAIGPRHQLGGPAQGVDDVVVIVHVRRGDDFPFGGVGVASGRDPGASEKGEAAQAEVALLRFALRGRHLPTGAGVGHQHAGLGFLDLEPPGHGAELPAQKPARRPAHAAGV